MAQETRVLPTPAQRVAHQPQDVWSIINEAAAKSTVKPIVNMGQGFFGYNPPDFVIKAAQDAVTRVDGNQYSPTQGRLRLRRAIATSYSPSLQRTIDPETEVAISTGANEGILSAIMAFIQPGDEVIVFEPFFDQYISNIKMAGGVIRYVPLTPPSQGHIRATSAGEWTLDMDQLGKTFTTKTRMIIINSPHNPVGKIFSEQELTSISQLCLQNGTIILADEVYDRLCYDNDPSSSFSSPSSLSSPSPARPTRRIATLPPPSTWDLTLTVGSAGKSFYATGWRVGFLIGPEHLIRYVKRAHTQICYSSPSPLQEACAVGYEQADSLGFWDRSRTELLGKIHRFVEVLEELGLPYTMPQGGYFVLVNFSQVKLPEDYAFPEEVLKKGARDFQLAWFLIMELGVAAIPPSEFYTEGNKHVVEDWLRFAICKEDEVLEDAKGRLRGLRKYIVV